MTITRIASNAVGVLASLFVGVAPLSAADGQISPEATDAMIRELHEKRPGYLVPVSTVEPRPTTRPTAETILAGTGVRFAVPQEWAPVPSARLPKSDRTPYAGWDLPSGGTVTIAIDPLPRSATTQVAGPRWPRMEQFKGFFEEAEPELIKRIDRYDLVGWARYLVEAQGTLLDKNAGPDARREAYFVAMHFINAMPIRFALDRKTTFTVIAIGPPFEVEEVGGFRRVAYIYVVPKSGDVNMESVRTTLTGTADEVARIEDVALTLSQGITLPGRDGAATGPSDPASTRPGSRTAEP